MKRFTAAALAAATSLALVGMPAEAAENKPSSETKRSSEVSDVELGLYVIGGALAEGIKEDSGVSQPFLRSSEKDPKVVERAMSSIKNDVAKEYKIGTTYDILVGTGIAAAILAVLGGGAWAFQQGLIKLPF